MRPRSLFPAFLLGLLAFTAYRLTAAPAVLPGDAGEFQFTVPLAGVSHPPGYPLYHLLGWLWARLYQANPAQGVNHFSALWGGVAVGLFYLLAYEALSQLLFRLRWRRGAGWLATITTVVWAANPTWWAQATQAEVYTLQMALVAALLGVGLAVGGWSTRPEPRRPRPDRDLSVLALLLGLGLSHHLTLLLLLPGLGLYLLWQRSDLFRWRWLLRALPFVLGPLLLYLYVPLRAPASPWLRLTLTSDHVLVLYDNSPAGLLRFVLGLRFADALRSPGDALAQIPIAGRFFFDHLGWVGLALIGLGLLALILEEQWPLLLLTSSGFLLTAAFNLFYGIGDIQAFYLSPLLLATLWLGLGLAYGVELLGRLTGPRLRPYGLILALAVLIWPYWQVQNRVNEFDRRLHYETTWRWQRILDQALPLDAILVSNDRDEMTPMLYFQHVLGRAPEMTALFPLMVPPDRPGHRDFADLNTTLATALATGRPVFLSKAMPGVEVRYEIEPFGADVFRVIGEYAVPEPVFEMPYGESMRWLHTAWAGTDQPDSLLTVDLYWRVVRTPPVPWHSFLQLFDEAGHKRAQAPDHRPGGDYLPAPLWRPGDVIRDRFALSLPADLPPGTYTLMAGFYDPVTGARVAAPLTVGIIRRLPQE
jgi:hypothetical protein